MKVRFTQDCTVDDFRKGTKDEESYKEGKVYDLPEASAARWILRGKAEQVTPKARRSSSKKAAGKTASGGGSGGSSDDGKGGSDSGSDGGSGDDGNGSNA